MHQVFITEIRAAEKAVAYMYQMKAVFDKKDEYSHINFVIDGNYMNMTGVDENNLDDMTFSFKIWTAGIGYYSGWIACFAEQRLPAAA